jgi:hypothetical protein
LKLCLLHVLTTDTIGIFAGNDEKQITEGIWR